MERLFRRSLLVVIQHESGAFRQTREQFSEELAAEGGNIGEILGGQQWERPLPPSGETATALPQVEEERGWIGIAGIDLVPDARQRSRVEPGCRQSGLPGSGRSDYTDGRTPPMLLIQPREQPLARNRPVQTRAG